MSFKKSVHIEEIYHSKLKLKAFKENSSIRQVLNDILEKALNKEEN